ncbi:MAG TPA: DUF177 domain-containing protein [Anaerolineae bacterium]|nr:DUF177 domain-containing protein [Anaerolineae bacterium]
MIRVNLAPLVHAELGLRELVTLNLSNLTFEDLTLNYLKGSLHFTRVAQGILCEGHLNAEVQVECIRCLTLFSQPIVIELEDIVGLPGADLTPERPVRVTEDYWVDLAPLIYEYAWLEIPHNAVCSPHCKGICPDCGGNLNLGECVCEEGAALDPRWDALKTLLK